MANLLIIYVRKTRAKDLAHEINSVFNSLFSFRARLATTYSVVWFLLSFRLGVECNQGSGAQINRHQKLYISVLKDLWTFS